MVVIDEHGLLLPQPAGSSNGVNNTLRRSFAAAAVVQKSGIRKAGSVPHIQTTPADLFAVVSQMP
jgi:hypothetical protein